MDINGVDLEIVYYHDKKRNSSGWRATATGSKFSCCARESRAADAAKRLLALLRSCLQVPNDKTLLVNGYNLATWEPRDSRTKWILK